MKNRIQAVWAAMTFLCLSFNSCTAALAEQTYTDHITSSGTSLLRLHIHGGDDTRSSISPDEDKISSICVMAYREADGILAAVQHSTSTGDMEMELACGSYNIYMTANIEGFQPPAYESGLSSECISIDSFAQLGESLPMCWQGKAELKPGKTATVQADLSRLVSKTEIKIDMGSIKGLEIRSVRLCQGAGKLWPFMDGGSRIAVPSDAMDGDYATEEDIRKLMAGETIWLYATENCQGVLLPDNTDPWAKIPENIGNSAQLCTYVEMTAEWTGSADFQGTVTYRFYLGGDSTSDFNIRRNTTNRLTLYLEEGSLGRISWKIDSSDTDPLRWSISSNLNNNFHDREDFYVTENIRLDFSFDKNGKIYWQNRNNAFIIAGIGDNDKIVIRFADPVDMGDGNFYAIGTCIDTGYYDIVLIDAATGEIEYFLEYGEIHTPKLMAGPAGIYADDKVQGFENEMDLLINNGEAELCLYLVDRNGYNINQSGFYGCNLELTDWSIAVRSAHYGHNLTKGSSIKSEQGECGSDSFAVRYIFSIANDGTDEAWNTSLAESLGPAAMDITFEERFSDVSFSSKMGLYCEDIDITFMAVPEESKTHLQSEFMYVIENPSHLPLNIRGLKMNSMHSIPSLNNIMPVICSPISGFVSSTPVLISRMPVTYCSLEDGAARWIIIGNRLCYAADDNGIEQPQIPNQTSMFHSFEADLACSRARWRPAITGHIDLYDSEEHRQAYGINGYINCGMAFHSPGNSAITYDSNNGRKTDFRKYGDLLGKEQIDKFNDIVEIQININENNEITATSSRNAEIRMSLSGSLNGHIRCVTIRDPLYILWGHYFTESVTFSHSCTVTTGREPVVIDGGALAGAFSEMRERPYYSVVDAWDIEEFRVDDHQSGTVREYLKPYGIDLNIQITTLDGSPATVRFIGSAKYDYAISSPVTWKTGLLSSVTMVPSSYSGFDDGLDDNDCPPGELFKAETLYLQPKTSTNTVPGIYYMTR